MKILMTIEYKGTNFSGWQTQPNKRTVQSEIESVLTKLFGEKYQFW
jgi:tRNA pseudouridine38-40 synthase